MATITITNENINDLRQAFLQAYENKDPQSVEEPDLNRIKSDDDYLRRFLMHHDGNQKLALEMMWEVVEWRKSFKVNEINENNIKMEYMVEGGFFSHGRDKDGAALFIFKCKKHFKGTKDMNELKRCVVYWFERLERQEKGKAITLFFDMESCGLSNMDMDFTKYLIGLFKLYYPYFLNYIIIFEMAWILNAAFKVIKSWLPEKAVQKIKMIKKGEIQDWVPLDQALTCWGGNDDYVYSFVSEQRDNETNSSTVVNSSKKVHFADGSPMTEAVGSVDCRDNDSGMLIVSPSSVIRFIKDGDEFISTLELQNNDTNTTLSFKMKTTAPEKFRVRPSAGILNPGERITINVNLLPAYQIDGLTKDKFLIMSQPVDPHINSQDLVELWKNTSGKNISQHRLQCAQISRDINRNGNAVQMKQTTIDCNQIAKLTSNMNELRDCQMKLEKAVQNTQVLQFITICLMLIIGFLIYFILRDHLQTFSEQANALHACYRDAEI